MPIFAVHYDYRENSTDARNEHRPAHRGFLDTLLSGPAVLVASGPYVDEPAGALLIFRADTAADIETALDADPFHLEGLIGERRVREWSQVKGPWAS